MTYDGAIPGNDGTTVSAPGTAGRARPRAGRAASVRWAAPAAAALVLASIALTGCGSSGTPSAASASSSAPNPNAPETVAPGDIPDTQVYVPFSPADGSFTVSVPQGWSQSTVHGATVFTDKFNSVQIETLPAPSPLDVATVTATEVPKLKGSVPGFVLGAVSAVQRSGGPAVRITYAAASAPNSVTGTTALLAVERYDFISHGKEIALTLAGAKGADNVDPWKQITDSFRPKP